MEVEKKRSKGGFLNLFDWNGKSRKKLFANNLEELPVAQGSTQEKEDEENFPKSDAYKVDVDENDASSSNKGSNDWTSASWATSDDGGGSKAPSVVARLMGLDSLPSSNVADPSSSSAQLSEVCLLKVKSAHHGKANLWNDFYSMEGGYVPKHDTFCRNPVESRPLRQHNRPIERFQTEVLPPKSAKSIPFTHHKLLSPIKNPGFIPTKNVTYIMEAAAKMIESSPMASSKSKVTSIGASSVPLRIRDLKEKMEAANKASDSENRKESGSLRFNKAQYRNKTTNGSEYVLVTRASVDSEKRTFNNSRDKGRSLSLAQQAKTNVQRREGSTSCDNKNSMKQKEHKEVKSNQLHKCQSSLHRSAQKRNSAQSSNNALRQNNQKQNSVSNKDKLTEKGSASNHSARRTRSSTNSIESTNKTVNKGAANSKTGPRKMGSATAAQRDTSSSTVKKLSQKKRSVCQDSNLEDSLADNLPISEGERSIKCNVTMDSCTNMSADNRKQSMDVISFTFNSPLKKSPGDSWSSGQVMMEKRFNSINDKDPDLYSKSFTLSSPGLNVIGADSLSVLLEQKLQELASKVQSYQSNGVREESSASCASGSQDFNLPSNTSRGGKQFQRDSSYNCKSPSVDGPMNNMNQQWQGSIRMEEPSVSSNNRAIGKRLDYQDLSPESSCEYSFESGSSADNRSNAKGNKGCSVAEVQTPSHGEIESSDSVFFSSTRNVSVNQVNRRFGFIDYDKPSNWELEYVRDIVSNAELALEDFALGHANKVISPPTLFDDLENEENFTEWNEEECCSKLGRKVLFDCVNESLELRSLQMLIGTCSRKGRLAPRKEWLAEEIHEEISVWKDMAELMVDDLVDKDMSTGIGRWLDFDNEAFEEGVEIEKGVLSCLLDDLVSDLMVF
ncbi:uncharacterized protein LOC115719372 [Cannabis sativa]|uniref:uncharacterized protein LOC115719372 n=1 Tax=Cannabis sativa TaxID=3483 RepID=UPI0029CA7A75|nr:uncharacterized protein LOC115719372 [Cannabis sativa]XP_030504249.2 uncharacterized protein LOC115719372 [Cannabis sativa]